MNIQSMKIRETVSMAALGVAVVVLLPLAAVAAFVLRAGLFAAVLLAVVAGLVAYAVSPRFREWLGYQLEPGLTYNGLRLDTGVALGDGHAWARLDGDEATVGADDLVCAVLGPVEKVELPGAGTRVRRGEPLFRLRHGDRTVAVASPIAGTVVHANPELARSPHLVHREPFDGGWAVRLERAEPRADRRLLRRGAEARSWFRGEVDRLLTDLLPGPAGAAPALPDGGDLVEGLYRHVDDATWSRLQDRFFTPAERDLS